MASGEDREILQYNLESVSKELLNIIAANDRGNVVLHDELLRYYSTRSCNNERHIGDFFTKVDNMTGKTASTVFLSSYSTHSQRENVHSNTISSSPWPIHIGHLPNISSAANHSNFNNTIIMDNLSSTSLAAQHNFGSVIIGDIMVGNLSDTSICRDNLPSHGPLSFNRLTVENSDGNSYDNLAVVSKAQCMSEFDLNYLPSYSVNSNIQMGKRGGQNVQCNKENSKSLLNSLKNRKSLLNLSLVGAKRKNKSDQTLIELIPSVDFNNDGVMIDFRKFGWTPTCKEPNTVLRLMALFRDLQHAIDDMDSNYEDDPIMDSAFEDPVSKSPNMPCTMNFQSQVKNSCQSLQTFASKIDSMLKDNQIYDNQLYLEYQGILNELQQLIKQLSLFKQNELEHRFGKFIKEIAKEQSEQLEKLLEKIIRQVRIVSTHIKAYDWFINSTYSKVKNEVHINMNYLKNNNDTIKYLNLQYQQFNKTNVSTKSNNINEILELVYVEKHKDIVAHHQHKQRLMARTKIADLYF